jgi:hypothetical protein
MPDGSKKILTRYKESVKDREKSEKYFRIKKDGYMVSDPYVQEEFCQGISKTVFNNLETAVEGSKEPRVGEMIDRHI